MEILILFFVALIGVAVGWHLREVYAIRQVRHLMTEHKDLLKLNDEEQVERTKMRLELHSGVIYAYSEEDNSFIAQGKDLEDLDLAIRSRFPDRKFSVLEDNLKEIGANYHESV